MNPETTDSPQETPSWTPPTAEQLAEMLPGYEASGQVGTGSLGPIYKARHLDSDRIVAIKLFPVQAPAEAAFVQRFKAEAQSLAAIHHPGIAPVIDYGRTGDGHLYLVWEYVEGTDLFQIQQRQGLSIAHVMELLPQLCASVQHAHDHGVLHRNIRPSNIIVRGDGKPVLIDFALVSPLLQDASHDTHQHLAIGTPDYIAPELLDGAGDCRVDVYSLGVVFYELLVGRIPRGRYEKPSKEIPSLDPRLDDVVDRAMKFDATERYASAHDMQVAIQMRHAHAPAPAPTSPEARSPDSVATAILEKLPFPERAAPPAPARPVAAPAEPPVAAPIAAPVATEWEDVHGTLPWWKKKLVWIAAATVVVLATVGGFWYRWLQTPEIAVRETTVEFLDGRRLGKETDVIVSTLGGTLDIDGLAGRLPEGLFFKPRTESDGTTHYRLFGEPKDLDHAPVEFALIAQNGSLQSQPARLTVLIRRTPLTWTVADKVELIIAEPVKADMRIATGIDTLDRQEWSPPCPGLTVDDAGISTTGYLLITGTPKITGTFQVSVKATSRGGISGDKTFTVVVSDPVTSLAMNDSKPVPPPPAVTPNASPEPVKTEPAKPAPAGGTASSGTVAMVPPTPNPAPPKGTEPAPEKPSVPSPTPAVATPPSPTPQGTPVVTMPAVPVAGTATPAPAPAPVTPAPVPVAPGVAEVRGDNYLTVFSPYGKHSITVSEQDWVAGKVLDQKAGRTLVLPNKEDPKLQIQDLTPLTFTAVNPYNYKPEVWTKEEWKDGAARPWGPFTYHLPTPVPVFKVQTAKYDPDKRSRSGGPILINPYNNSDTVALTWREFVKGGEVKDKKGQPMLIPTIKDPELKARSIDRARQSYVNPYTGEREPWSGKSEDFKEGAQVSWQPGFTFTLADFPPEKKAEPPKPEVKPEPKKAEVAVVPPPMPKEAPKVEKPAPPPPQQAKPGKLEPPGPKKFGTSRGFNMSWDPTLGYWIGLNQPTANTASLAATCEELTKQCIQAKKIPANFHFVARTHSDGVLRMMAVPK